MKLLTRPLDLSEKLMIIWAAVKSFIVDCCRYYRREEIIVKTKTGLVKGFKIASDYEYRYFNFIGIPYAKPPIGDLRFKVNQFIYVIPRPNIEQQTNDAIFLLN